MTQKELSYVEDATSHEIAIISIIEESINKLQDEELISFMNEELNNHQKTKNSLINILEEKSNE